MKNLRLLLLAGIILVIGCVNTPEFKNSKGKRIPNSINEIVKVKFNNVDQWLFIRGKNRNNPIMLFLHGGPGSPETPYIRKFNPELEEIFTIVYLEQRGAGKSYNKKLTEKDLEPEKFILDIHEATKYIKNRFKREKIYLMGHSWGSFIGINAAHKYANDYIAYFGIGQVCDQLKSEQLSYDFVLNRAKEENNKKAIKELESIGRPSLENQYNFDEISIERKWVYKYGGAIYGEKGMWKVIKPIIFQEEYSFGDVLKFIKGTKESVEKVFYKTMYEKLDEDIVDFEIPIYLFQGKYDYQTVTIVAKAYFDKINAPKKEFFVFEKSAHSPIYEQPIEFNQKIKQILRTTKTLKDK